jgi:hypothetical protein
MPTNIQSSCSNDPYSSSALMGGNTPYDSKRPFLLNDGYGELAPISNERQYHAVLNPTLEGPSGTAPMLNLFSD